MEPRLHSLKDNKNKSRKKKMLFVTTFLSKASAVQPALSITSCKNLSMKQVSIAFNINLIIFETLFFNESYRNIFF